MDVVGVMAAYLSVVRVCTVQSREALRIIKCFNCIHNNLHQSYVEKLAYFNAVTSFEYEEDNRGSIKLMLVMNLLCVVVLKKFYVA